MKQLNNLLYIVIETPEVSNMAKLLVIERMEKSTTAALLQQESIYLGWRKRESNATRTQDQIDQREEKELPLLRRPGLAVFLLPLTLFDHRKAREHGRQAIQRELKVYDEFVVTFPKDVKTRRAQLAFLFHMFFDPEVNIVHPEKNRMDIVIPNFNSEMYRIGFETHSTQGAGKPHTRGVISLMLFRAAIEILHNARESLPTWSSRQTSRQTYEADIANRVNYSAYTVELPKSTLARLKLEQSKCGGGGIFGSKLHYLSVFSNPKSVEYMRNPTSIVSELSISTVALPPFPYTLKDVQVDAFNKTMDSYFGAKRQSALIQLPCGSGKTILAMKIIHELLIQRQVITHINIFVPTREIGSMWFENLDSVFKPMGQGLRERIFVHTFQSLTMCQPMTVTPKYEYSLHLHGPRKFLTIVDEVHHVAATTFHKVMTQMVPSSMDAFKLGLTGTLDRKDDLRGLIEQVFENNVTYTRKAIDDERNLGWLLTYKLIYGFSLDESTQLTESSNMSHHQLLKSHAVSSTRARWIVSQLLPKLYDSEGPYKRKHAMILVARLEQMKLLLETLVEFDKKHDTTPWRPMKIELKHSKSAGSKIPELGKLLSQLNSNAATKGIPGTAFMIGIIDMVGEGFNNTSIDCIIFGDPAKDMMQNGNRLRKSDNGMIVYLGSPMIANGRAIMASDVKKIRTELFKTVTHTEDEVVDIN